MNRRNFIGNVLRLGAAFAILPTATTYARRWIAAESGLLKPSIEIVTDLETMDEMRFLAVFKYYTRPLHFDYARVYFHAREQFNQPIPCPTPTS